MALVDTSKPRNLKVILKGEVLEFDVHYMLSFSGDSQKDFSRLMQDLAWVSAMQSEIRVQRLKVKNLVPQVRNKLFLSYKLNPQNMAAKFNPEIRKVTESEADAAARSDDSLVALQDEEAELDAAHAALDGLNRHLEMKFDALEEFNANLRTDKRASFNHGDR